MSAATRQSKPPRKGPDPARRAPAAWGNPRASPVPANPRLLNGNQQPQPGAFPPLANGVNGTNGVRPPPPDPNHARWLSQISGLTGTTITVSTKNNIRFEGVVSSVGAEGDTNGITLKDVKEVSNPGAPLRENLFIPVSNVQEWASGPADAKVPNGTDTFKTDTDISNKAGAKRERELQAWQPESAEHVAAAASPVNPPNPPNARSVDEVTFGTTASGGSWDQFAANEKLFGVKAGFDEDVYTTKLDRSAPDFKERERKAAQLASEIMSSQANNVHVAEERVMNLTGDASTANEEDKYGAVVRGANAYIPPGARKPGAPTATTPPAKMEIPKVAVNAPDGSAVPTSTSTPSASKGSSPAPGASGAKPADAVPAFRDFVSTEKDRLLKKKHALLKSDMDKRLSDLVSFSKNFKLNKPIPDDLVPILAKDEDKQRLIKEKSTRDAEDSRARTIALSTVVPPAGVRPTVAKPGADTTRAAVASKPSGSSSSALQKNATAPSKPGDNPKKINMFIQPIPPFKSKRPTTSSSATHPQPISVSPPPSDVTVRQGPLSPTAAQNRLNVNASSFRPNAKASAFSPAGSPSSNNGTASASTSGTVKQSENSLPLVPPNPFFGNRVFKRLPPVHVKDDFNPFKHHKVTEAAQVSPQWAYNGKRYMHMFPPIQVQPQQQSPPMAPPGPPPPPIPQQYEEDPAAQAARGFVYAYPPYGYPGQMVPPMMPGMAPPPGPYMPSPYMQPMPYHMPPPGAMYPPTPMGQMPPPQYMPPPPGSYPPPPNGAGGPRPSMPPTPIPSHAHPYYHHQSPQLQHAVPYPMMMPPPGSVPPHPYDPNAQQPPPPVQMGGVNHA